MKCDMDLRAGHGLAGTNKEEQAACLTRGSGVVWPSCCLPVVRSALTVGSFHSTGTGRRVGAERAPRTINTHDSYSRVQVNIK